MIIFLFISFNSLYVCQCDVSMGTIIFLVMCVSVMYQWGQSFFWLCVSVWCINGDNHFFGYVCQCDVSMGTIIFLVTCVSVQSFFVPYPCTPSGWGSVPRVAVPARERHRVHPAAAPSRCHLRPPAAGPHGWERWGKKLIWNKNDYWHSKTRSKHIKGLQKCCLLWQNTVCKFSG